jgi:hypothetical protein
MLAEVGDFLVRQGFHECAVMFVDASWREITGRLTAVLTVLWPVAVALAIRYL